MIDYVHNHFAANAGERVRPQLRLADGTALSVQASEGHYCTPRDRDGPHSAVEVMVVAGPHPREFITANGRRAEDGVYGWVRVDTVNAVIRRKGGLA